MDSSELASQIDLWLRTQPRWISGAEICERFGVTNERRLRFDKDRPGLLSFNCVSCSQRGFKHLRFVEADEFAGCDGKDRKHNVTRYLVLRARRNAWRNERTGKRPEFRELHTGQLVFV
jgi:hypothetical protein